MGRRRDDRAKVELGDFQTPPELAAEICQVLVAQGVQPRAIVEPTCGSGSFLIAALDAFPRAACALGVELQNDHVRAARRALRGRGDRARVVVEVGDFFGPGWPERIAALPDPILFVGNPPWVTNSDLGSLKSDNLPEKTNFHGHAGLDALTGKSNFDISEWMLLKLLSWLDRRDAIVAMLCKASVARKVLAFGWSSGMRIRSAATYRIDAARHFGAAVDACLLVCELGEGDALPLCRTFDSLQARAPDGALGYRGGRLVADVTMYDRWRELQGDAPYKWRSGIKHDCAAVMELRRTTDGFKSRAAERMFENGDGERVDVEDRFLYPMLKSSDVANSGSVRPQRYMLVTQTLVGEDTEHIRRSAPRTWRYLTRHRARFEGRASTIYRGKPAFSIFGVGDYTFSPWKVAISGLYKKLEFRVVGPHDGKPVVFDDTCYFLPCGSEAEAQLLWSMLSSEPAQQFYASLVFWDAKRPITTDLLRQLDLRRLAHALDRTAELERVGSTSEPGSAAGAAITAESQLTLAIETVPRRGRARAS